MITTEDKERQFEIDIKNFREFLRIFREQKKESEFNSKIKSAIEFLESQGYKVIKN